MGTYLLRIVCRENRKPAAYKKQAFVLIGLWIISICFIGSFGYSTSGEPGFKYFQNYSYKDYNHLPQNYGMVQSPNGFIYVANNGGILEYDGVTWSVINVINSQVYSLDVDMNSTIYVGGVGEFGYLAPSEEKKLKYISLFDQIKNKKNINFSIIFSVHATPTGIYFRCPEILFRWNFKHVEVILQSKDKFTSFESSFWCDGTLYIKQPDKPLSRLKNNRLEILPDGEKVSKDKIKMVVPYRFSSNNRSILIGTDPGGFFIFDGKQIKPFSIQSGEFLEKAPIQRGFKLHDGNYAIASLKGGVWVMDQDGKVKNLFNESYGMLENTAYNVFEDQSENLWICMEQGLSKIEYRSPLTNMDEHSGLPGLVLSVIRYKDVLYASTTKGLFCMNSSFQFTPIPGVSIKCTGLYSVNDSLLALTDGGLFEVKENSVLPIIRGGTFCLSPSPKYPNQMWCGTSSGVSLLSFTNGQWEEEKSIQTPYPDIRSIMEDLTGKVWMLSGSNHISEINLNKGIEKGIRVFDESDGLHGTFKNISSAKGHVVFLSDYGIFRFDEKSDRFVPDTILGEKYAGGPNGTAIFRLLEDTDHHIWFNSRSANYHAIPHLNKTYEISQGFLARIPIIQTNAIYPDPDRRIIWFATNDGLIRFDKTEPYHQEHFHTVIRRVVLNDSEGKETTIFEGAEKNYNTKRHGLDYKNRNIRFEFAAPYFKGEAATKYRCRLEGYENEWSPLSKESRRIYTNLDPGKYKFRVQAQNVFGQFGSEDYYSFKVFPPFYRTWWAYTIYIISFIALLFLFIKWRASKLVREKQILEETVKERTKEIQEKNKTLEEQAAQLKNQSEQLKEMDRIKSRFFANISHEFRTPLTLIMGPLEQLISECQDEALKKKYKMMLHNSGKLLSLINQLLDLSKYDSGKAKLQASFQNIVPFLKEKVEQFHSLAIRNNLELVFLTDREEIFLYFEGQKMDEAISNLLINAVKFTPAGGKITVSVSILKEDSTGDFVNISVKDSGIGIPANQLPHVFDRFFQSNHIKENNRQGTGIGLSLTKEIVTSHSGKIDVHSQEGEGTEFVLQIPLGKDHLKPEEIVGEDLIGQSVKKESIIKPFIYFNEDELNGYGSNGECSNLNDKTKPGKKAKKANGEEEKPIILVVEDNTDVRKFIREPLEPQYKVIEACNGKEGIELAKKEIPDLIISDIMMPEADGYELCRELKTNRDTGHIPIILLTAKASEENTLEGLETGANDYITKPFNPQILMTRIRNMLELQQQMQLKVQREGMLLPSDIPVSSMEKNFFEEFKGVIEKNLSDPEFAVDQIAGILVMGRATLFRKIKAITGETPNQFILSYRLNRAAQLLREHFGNVTEVAMAAGFNSSNYFATCFKEKFGETPSEYQATHSTPQDIKT